MFSFDRLITPKIIALLYIAALIGLFVGAIACLAEKQPLTAVMLIISTLFCRIFFECMIISFKNNEYLRRIAESAAFRDYR